jgi:hypothetical protein
MNKKERGKKKVNGGKKKQKEQEARNLRGSELTLKLRCSETPCKPVYELLITIVTLIPNYS